MLSAKYLCVQIRCREAPFLGCFSGSQTQAIQCGGLSLWLRAGSEDHIAEGVSRNGWNNGSITRNKSVTSHRSDFERKHVGHFFKKICNSEAFAKTWLPWQVVAENTKCQKSLVSVLLPTSFVHISLFCASVFLPVKSECWSLLPVTSFGIFLLQKADFFGACAIQLGLPGMALLGCPSRVCPCQECPSEGWIKSSPHSPPYASSHWRRGIFS